MSELGGLRSSLSGLATQRRYNVPFEVGMASPVALVASNVEARITFTQKNDTGEPILTKKPKIKFISGTIRSSISPEV
jgi:hypothetical protein